MLFRSLSLLSSILDELRDDSKHPLLQKEEWQQVLKEAKRDQLLSIPVDKLTLDIFRSSQYQIFCDILLSLARVSD